MENGHFGGYVAGQCCTTSRKKGSATLSVEVNRRINVFNLAFIRVSYWPKRVK